MEKSLSDGHNRKGDQSIWGLDDLDEVGGAEERQQQDGCANSEAVKEEKSSENEEKENANRC